MVGYLLFISAAAGGGSFVFYTFQGKDPFPQLEILQHAPRFVNDLR